MFPIFSAFYIKNLLLLFVCGCLFFGTKKRRHTSGATQVENFEPTGSLANIFKIFHLRVLRSLKMGELSYFILFHSITLYFLVFPTAFRLHIKCTPKRNDADAERSIAHGPAVCVITATVSIIASSASTRVSISALSVSRVLCSPFISI